MNRRHVIVVGGGVLGCAIAYRLSRGGIRVTLLERDGIAAHASASNAGNLNPLHGTLPSLIPLALEAFHAHVALREELGHLGCADYGLTPVKRVHLGYDEHDQTMLEETRRLFDLTDGFSAQWLLREDLRRIEPRLSPNLGLGLETSGNLSVEGGDFTRSLARAAILHGAIIMPAAVVGIVATGDRLSGVKTASGTISCDDAVFATGPWVDETNTWLGIDLAVEPVKGELLRMRLQDGGLDRDFTLGSTSLYRRRQSEIWIGTTTARVGFNCQPTEAAKSLLIDGARCILPDISKAMLLDHTAALRPMTDHGMPLAARAPGWRNAYIANGGGSKGILLSVAIASRVTDAVLEQTAFSVSVVN